MVVGAWQGRCEGGCGWDGQLVAAGCGCRSAMGRGKRDRRPPEQVSLSLSREGPKLICQQRRVSRDIQEITLSSRGCTVLYLLMCVFRDTSRCSRYGTKKTAGGRSGAMLRGESVCLHLQQLQPDPRLQRLCWLCAPRWLASLSEEA